MSSQSSTSATPAAIGLKLDCANSSRPVWLVKVPKYLAQAFESATVEDVGQLSIAKDKSSGKVEIKLKVKDSVLVHDKSIPTTYEVPLTPFTAQKMAVMAKIGDPAGLIMDGFVNRRADIRPAGAGNVEYMKMKQAHIKKAMKPTRCVVQIDERVNNFKPVDNKAVKRKSEKEAPKPEKKLRGDKDRVMEHAFAAFETHQYYTLHDLVEQLNQPAGFLKTEILKEICNYNTKGAHKNTYELKPEFRHYSSEKESKA